MKPPQRLSLVTQTVALLREQIAGGGWPKQLPSEGELGAKLHISRVTLRKALAELSREGLIRSRKGKRHELVRKRRRLALPASRQVVLLTPSPLHLLPPNALFWIDALREYLAEEGDHHLDIQVHRVAYGQDPEHALKNLLEQMRPAGWVLYKSTGPMQRWFSNHKLPCVITGSRHEGVELPSVDLAYRAVCRHAAGLFMARGHQRLALVNPASGLSGDFESEQGFTEAAGSSRQAAARVQVVRHNATVEGICNKLDALLGQPQPPTAFLVSRPEHVLTVVSHLLRRGKLPREASLISRDDALFLEDMVPSIARYAFDPQIFARKIFKSVLGMVQGSQAKPFDHQIMPRFVPGHTLG